MMGRLWVVMTELYGHKWVSQHGKQPTDLWVRAGMHIPEPRYAVALNRVRAQRAPWPPSLPEFEALCRVEPEEIGAPSVDVAFREACHGSYPFNHWPRWSHKAVYWAAVWTGQTDLAEHPQQVRKTFEDEYRKAIQSADALDDPPAAALADRPEVYERDTNSDGFKRFMQAKAGEAESSPKMEYRPGIGLVRAQA